ncbi:MAG: hypothetical protein ACYC0T_21755 [Ramlibacter sp.]
MNEQLVTQEENMPVGIGGDNLIQMAEQAEKRVDAIIRIKRAALKVTNERDWSNQNGNPYLEGSGSEKVARLFGISWSIDPPVITNNEDGHFSYTYKGYFSLGSATIEFEGSRGSDDGFFSRGDKLPPSEIDKNDVKKSALTNTIGNGVTRILGIRNLSWEDLKNAGLDIEKIKKIDYTKPEMSGEAKDLKTEISKMLSEMSGNDEKKIENLILKHTSFVSKDGKEVIGKTSLVGLSEKSIPVVYGKIKTAYEAWKGTENEPV